MFAEKPLQQTGGGLADADRVISQLGAVAGDVRRILRMESCPKLGQPRPLSHLLSAVEFTVELQAHGQQFFVGEVESVAFSARNGLEYDVFQEPAVGMAAKAGAPGDAAAAATGQP